MTNNFLREARVCSNMRHSLWTAFVAQVFSIGTVFVIVMVVGG